MVFILRKSAASDVSYAQTIIVRIMVFLSWK
jgi:hypothetical protein